MRVPLSWLRAFVPVDAAPADIAERLSLSGLAVEQMIEVGAGISGVVVAEVRAMREHPDADSLMLVTAFDGAREHAIVCGARNYAVGDRVPLARPGAKLPGGMEIGSRRIRGEASEGMLCSARELGIAEDHSGILLLGGDAPLGQDLASLGIDDVVFDLDVTPNRPDCMSVVGVAREIAALYGLPLTVERPEVPEGEAPIDALASVRVEDARGCPRYLARVIEGVRIAPSPWWLRRRLLLAGMRPISNVVDVTNYVLLERGQPLHAFDLDRLSGSAIIVRKPRARETITTLDDVERTLDRTDVVICDADRPVAIAGVMGGADSEVTGTTTRLLLESAYFDPIRIARTARRLGLRTEASARFERGADPSGVDAAADVAAALFADLAGGTVARGAVDVYPRPRPRKPIRLRTARASAVIGAPQETGSMAGSLRAIGCAVEEKRSSLRATPPTWRPDLVAEEDLIEEVARLYGYDRIPSTLPFGSAGGLSVPQRRARLVRAALRAAGLNEATTLSLIPPGFPERLGLPADHPWRATRAVANPLSEEESILRPSLVPGLLTATALNVARRVSPVRLSEVGTVFAATDDGVTESARVAFVIAGAADEGWLGAERDLDFFDGKGVVEALFATMGLEAAWRSGQERAPFHPGRTAEVLVDGEVVGLLAELHPRAAEALEVPARTVCAEFDLGALTRAPAGTKASVVPRFPAVTRDIAVVVPDAVAAAQVVATITGAGGPLLTAVDLFDVYRGDPIPAGSVSLAFALAFRDPERTLTDEDAEAAMDAIAGAVGSAGWSVRA